LKPLRILYVGTESGTCLDRANAYRRMGHEVTHLDMRRLLPKTIWVDRITWRIGGHVFAPVLIPKVREFISNQKFDLCHVDNGEWMSPSVIKVIRAVAPKVINYSIDDSTGPRDSRRFTAYRRALPFYDLVAVMREVNVVEARKFGAKNVLRVLMTADEVTHAPRNITPAVAQKWGSEVLFLGTWMPERGPFLRDLVQLGVPLAIRGTHWQKAPEWPQLQPHWLGGAVYGDDYAYALQCAKVNIGLLSKGNRDLHTTRSQEIPALGALLCAERTSEHSAMYDEGKEALFWSDARECAEQCKKVLADEGLRQRISQAGQARFKQNQHGNQNVLQTLLDAAFH
jgi:spore maturation protein CgeB